MYFNNMKLKLFICQIISTFEMLFEKTILLNNQKQ